MVCPKLILHLYERERVSNESGVTPHMHTHSNTTFTYFMSEVHCISGSQSVIQITDTSKNSLGIKAFCHLARTVIF